MTGNFTIEKSWTNGYDRQVLVSSRLGEPSSLAIDYYQGHRVFWCDYRLQTLESVNYDGTDRVIIYTTPEHQRPFFIDVFGE